MSVRSCSGLWRRRGRSGAKAGSRRSNLRQPREVALRMISIGKIERLRLRALKEAHTALLQRARQSDEKLARTKTAAEAVDHAAGVKTLRGAVPALDLCGGEGFEETRAALVCHRHERPQIAVVHELV